MKQFNDKDFLLNNETAKILYHQYAEHMPIYDYHCHLPIKDIYENRVFDDISLMWLADNKAGDHYKWRALRLNGVSEHYITGYASNIEKFHVYAKTMPYLIGNPLYSWTHLELSRYFGINETLCEGNYKEIYSKMNEVVKSHGVRDFINMNKVDTLCTTDDPIDDLKYHKLLKEDKSFKTKVLPTFRPDKAIKINDEGYVNYINQLSKVSKIDIKSIDDLVSALDIRAKYFLDNGCLISDQSLEHVNYICASKEEVDKIFKKALNKETLTKEESAKYGYYLLVELGKIYHKFNFAMQLHINAKRNNVTRLYVSIGPDAGGDSINDENIIEGLSLILDSLDKINSLPKTIAYSLNPRDLDALATLIFSYSEDNVKGKMQLGSAWWFLDQKQGILNQLKALSNYGVLANFIGMLTDSRSFLSYSRHEYFRRVLCNYIGELIENGEYPNDLDFVGNIVKDICFNNAKRYFEGE